jgi:uncharacterized protein (DUF58 family)
MPLSSLHLELAPETRGLLMKVRQNILSRSLEGNFTTMFRGRGIEFSGFRKYVYGDDASLIDWPASLRSKETLIRTFDLFKSFRALILVDVSNSMLFCSTRADKLKAEIAAELASHIGYAVLRTNNAAGLAMFSDHLKARVPPDIGAGVNYRFSKYLADPSLYGGGFDFKAVIKQTLAFQKEPALIIIISDFIGLEEGWINYLLKLAERNEVLGIMLRDPRDRDLPAQWVEYVVADPFSSAQMQVDALEMRKAYRETVEREERLIRRSFLLTKSHFISLRTDEEIWERLMGFFKRGFRE